MSPLSPLVTVNRIWRGRAEVSPAEWTNSKPGTGCTFEYVRLFARPLLHGGAAFDDVEAMALAAVMSALGGSGRAGMEDVVGF